jgi:hypothetical protein
MGKYTMLYSCGRGMCESPAGNEEDSVTLGHTVAASQVAKRGNLIDALFHTQYRGIEIPVFFVPSFGLWYGGGVDMMVKEEIGGSHKLRRAFLTLPASRPFDTVISNLYVLYESRKLAERNRSI